MLRVVPILLALVLAAASADAPKLIVLDFQKVGAVSDAEVQSIDDAVVQVLTATSLFQVVSQRDVATLLGVERQKQLLGCSEESASCLSELSGALDARFVVSGTLNRIGDTWQLTLQTLDARKAQPAGRSLRAAKSLEQLRQLLPFAVAEATGTPAPKPPSRVLPTLLMVAGGLSLAAGGVALFSAETTATAVTRELAQSGPLPHTLAEYDTSVDDLRKQQTVGLILLSVGAALAAGGAWWFFGTPDVGSGQVALVPTGAGLALVGSFR